MELELGMENTTSREATCMSIAAGLHVLMLLWNPVVLKSDFHPAHDFVTVDVVEAPGPGGGGAPEEPKRGGLMNTLKDMLMKPKMEEIAHRAPNEPPAQRVAAPIQPALKERSMPRPIATAFQPKSSAEDLATAKDPAAIQTQSRNMAPMPTGAPALTSKSFGGIRAKDLPFQVSGEDSIATSGGAAIPVAVGRGSAKNALNYGGASLTEAKNRRVGISPSAGGGLGDLATVGAGSAANIDISGTGGTGNAPTGAQRGNVLQDRAGSGGGGLGSGRGFGYGRGSGSGYGSGGEGMPSAARELDASLAAGSSGGSGGRAKKGGQGFEISGPLNNRGIQHKVIPQYPAWAEEQGIIGSVRLYFTVTPEGSVRNNIRVTKTTGYPQLDQLAIDALKQWRFAPVTSSDEGKGEWGIITFNFALSS